MPGASGQDNPRPGRPLLAVRGPGQYTGGEVNQIVKPQADLRIALAFADVYSVGMSHHGLRVLYDIANRLEGVAAERVFAPFPDYEALLRQEGRPLTTLETATPLSRCHLVGFSLGYELAATSVLTILDLGGIPLTRRERENGQYPLVLAGGAAVLNPEPLADFIDAFFLGEAEEALPEILALTREFLPLTAGRRRDLLRELATRVAGVYIPAFYHFAPGPGGYLFPAGTGENHFAPFPVHKRLVQHFDLAPLPVRPLVPLHECIHERLVLEIMRGCPNGCRFCQAGYTGRPRRERSPDTLLAAARAGIAATGYDEISLLSLSTSNYTRFAPLLACLDQEFTPAGVGLSLPSLRVDHALSGIPAKLAGMRKSGLTVAPEAGSDRLRAVINKPVTNAHLLAAAEEAFRRDWKRLKLYFMVGLPTETEADAQAIAELALAVAAKRRRGGKAAVQLSVANFVPKAFTAFQWLGAAGPAVWEERQRLVSRGLNPRQVSSSTHPLATSLLEAVIARGDRRLGAVILAAWKKGARLDSWTEYFRPAVWTEAFGEAGLDPQELASHNFTPGEPLPWDHIDCGVSQKFLAQEAARAWVGTPTPACGSAPCPGCGVAGCLDRVGAGKEERSD
ncbi:MAG: TIGR03960 family B12-binding radical SAM protein [Planctomycetota bacterium]|nr:TIGR03960 family B12-binding radical SAM protein [Planctomycetota bacterium]